MRISIVTDAWRPQINGVVRTLGVDHELFRPRSKRGFPGLPRPIALCAGRVAIEKGLPEFLDLDLPGSKVVVGDGPMLAELQSRYPDVHFTGYLEGETLAEAVASADVLVFPSRTDTFGLVMIETLASGVPVAAFDVPGPRDIITDEVGAIGPDLGISIRRALGRPPQRCRDHALTFSWDRAADQFQNDLAPLDLERQEQLRRFLRAHASGARTPLPILARPK